MQHRIVFFSLLLLLSTSVFAQADSKVVSGIVAYNSGEYEKALDFLNQGLADESLLKTKNIAKAWLYKGKSLVAIVQIAQQSKDNERITKYANGLLDAVDAFSKAVRSDDENQKIAAEAREQMNFLINPILQTALSAMNQQLYGMAMTYLNSAAKIGEQAMEHDYYVTYDLRAQVFMLQGDSTLAYKDFQHAIELYNASPPETPDMLVAYMFYIKALIERYQMMDMDKAVASLTAGKQKLETEWQRLQGVRTSFSVEQLSQLQSQYENAKTDLGAFELDILMNSPKMYDQALLRFEQAIKENPGDYTMHVAYASLLEKSDVQKAEEMYLKAIEIMPDEYIAHFNLGALYVNKAIEVARKMNETSSDELYNALSDEMKALYALALPQLVKAYELNPADRIALDTIISIALQLDMEEIYMTYKQKRDALKD